MDTDSFDIISTSCIFNQILSAGSSGIILKSSNNKCVAKIVFLDINMINYSFENIKTSEKHQINVKTMDYMAVCNELEIHNKVNQICPTICPLLYGARFNIKNIQAILKSYDADVVYLLDKIQKKIDNPTEEFIMKPCVMFIEYIDHPTLFLEHQRILYEYNDADIEVRQDLQQKYANLIEQSAFIIINLLIKTKIFHADYTKRNIIMSNPPKLIDFGYAYEINTNQMKKIKSFHHKKEYLGLMRYLFTLGRNDDYILNESPKIYGYMCGTCDDLLEGCGSSFNLNFNKNIQALFDNENDNNLMNQRGKFYFNNVINIPQIKYKPHPHNLLFTTIIKFLTELESPGHLYNNRSADQIRYHLAVYFMSNKFNESDVYYVTVAYMLFFGFFFGMGDITSEMISILRQLKKNNDDVATIYQIIDDINKNDFVFYNIVDMKGEIYDLKNYFMI